MINIKLRAELIKTALEKVEFEYLATFPSGRHIYIGSNNVVKFVLTLDENFVKVPVTNINDCIDNFLDIMFNDVEITLA